MNERDTFLRAIADAWDDPTPVLVFADWAEEHGTDNPPLLRWYGWHVMPALAAVPPAHRRVNDAAREQARRRIRPHPQADNLFRLAAVAFCRRACVWDRDDIEPVRAAAEQVRLCAVELLPDSARLSAFRGVNSAATAAAHAVTLAHLGAELSEARRLERRAWVLYLASDMLDAAGPAVADRTANAAGAENTPAERGWQAAVYAALAAVPPLVVDEGRAAEVETVHERESKNLPPMKLPRGKFRRIVVRGRAYGWMARVDPDDWRDRPYQIVVRAADNTGQRLRVRPAPPRVLPGLMARIIADALAGGWRPTVDGLPDFEWDGNPYLV